MSAGARDPIGLIAGSGLLPLMFAEAASRAGLRVVAAAHEEETDRALESHAEVTWVRLGQLGRILDAFAAAGVKRAVFAGGIRKVRFLGPGAARPDARGVRLLAGLRRFGDDSLLRAIAAAFEQEGVEIVAPTDYLADCLAPRGPLGNRALTSAQRADVEVGVKAARALGDADVGQTVVVRKGVVVAVEAAEGTDACIARGAALAGPGCVVVKRAKPRQDLRFDVPAVGPGTIASLAAARASALAIEAGRTVVIDRAGLSRDADKARIAVVGT